MGLLDRLFGPKISVHLLLKGRVGEGWLDVDRTLRLPEGATLGALIQEAERQGIPLERALAESPHLSDTLMLNGERCPVAENRGRALADGDRVYLLAPIAGG
jgi:molybdopterin converting factor small subunit